MKSFHFKLPTSFCIILSIISFLPVLTFANSITKLIDNGPDSNRIVFVIIGDGYRDQDQNIFNNDADTVISYFQNKQPWSTYWNFINWYRLNVASEDSGITIDDQQIERNTAFGVRIDGDAIFKGPFSPEQDTIKNYLSSWHCALLIANDGSQKGGGYPNLAVFAKGTLGNAALHETGHSFAGLADEYVISSTHPLPQNTDEPNVTLPPDTAASGPNAVKWAVWLTPDVPIPTPDDFDYLDVVGVFDGAKYSKGCYRPGYTCIMQTGGGFYCRICTEAIVLKIKENVTTTESYYPPPTVYYCNFPVAFDLSLLDENTIPYDIKWHLDYSSTPIKTGTNELTLNPWDLGQDPHHLEVIITDTTRYDFYHGGGGGWFVENTRFVRNDPTGLMSDTIEWNIFYGWDSHPAGVLADAGERQRREARRKYSIVSNNIHVGGGRGDFRMRIYDLQGRLLAAYNGGRQPVSLPWQRPAASVYFIKLDEGMNTQAQRIIVR